MSESEELIKEFLTWRTSIIETDGDKEAVEKFFEGLDVVFNEFVDSITDLLNDKQVSVEEAVMKYRIPILLELLGIFTYGEPAVGSAVRSIEAMFEDDGSSTAS